MRYWQTLTFCEMEQLEALAIRAEELGFDGVSLGDHWVTAREQLQVYDYAEDGMVLWNADTHWPDPWVQFAALAKVTRRLHFMTGVYVLPMRDAFSVAKAVATAAFVSGGRVELGVGGGWQRLEFDLVGKPYQQRGKHLDEQLDVIQLLWKGEMVEYHGDFYNFPPLQMSPPAPPIPIYIGGHAPVALRRAARHDGWLGACYPFEQIAPLLEQVRTARLEAGGSLADFRILLSCEDLTPERLRALEEMGVTDYYNPTFLVDNRAVPSSLDYKLEQMEAFAGTYLS